MYRTEAQDNVTAARWSPGTAVALRGIAHDKVWIAHAVRVIEDTADHLAVYLQPGAQCKIPRGLIGRKYSGSANSGSRWDEQDGGAWTLVDWRWQQRSAVILMQPNQYFAVFCFRSAAADVFESWYVNFQSPFSRSATTIDTLDLEIDLVVNPDLSWYWKDEEEFQAGVQRGSITAEQAQQVAAAREEILGLLGTNSSLFSPRWTKWHPDPPWDAPSLPADWQTVGRS